MCEKLARAAPAEYRAYLRSVAHEDHKALLMRPAAHPDQPGIGRNLTCKLQARAMLVGPKIKVLNDRLGVHFAADRACPKPVR